MLRIVLQCYGKFLAENSAFCHFFFTKEPAVRSLFSSRCSVDFEGTEAQEIRLLYGFSFFAFPQPKFSALQSAVRLRTNQFEQKQSESQWGGGLSLLHFTSIHQPKNKNACCTQHRISIVSTDHLAALRRCNVNVSAAIRLPVCDSCGSLSGCCVLRFLHN
jgi:hypothetical protein